MVWVLIFHYRDLSPVLLFIEAFHVNKVINALDNITKKVVTNGFIVPKSKPIQSCMDVMRAEP